MAMFCSLRRIIPLRCHLRPASLHHALSSRTTISPSPSPTPPSHHSRHYATIRSKKITKSPPSSPPPSLSSLGEEEAEEYIDGTDINRSAAMEGLDGAEWTLSERNEGIEGEMEVEGEEVAFEDDMKMPNQMEDDSLADSIGDMIRPFDDAEKARIEEQIKKEMAANHPAATEELASSEGSYYFAGEFTGNLMSLEELLEILEESRALDLVVIDMRKKCGFCHYMVFTTGQNMRHMHVMAMRVVKDLRRRRIRGLNPSIEGEGSDIWMLVDCGNLVLNVFSPEGRAYYDLERKWAFTNHLIDDNGALAMNTEEDLQELDELKTHKKRRGRNRSNKKRLKKEGATE